jgi:hypothetical protein
MWLRCWQVQDAPTYNAGDALHPADEQLLKRVKGEFVAVHGPRLIELGRHPDRVMENAVKAVELSVLGLGKDGSKVHTTAAPVYTVPEVSVLGR